MIPAIVEELFFRASLQKIFMDIFEKPYWAIVITAIIFSAFHFSYFGFLSRLALGTILGYIYYYSKTIWLPILLHFVNNGIAVVTLYLFRNSATPVEKIMDDNLPIYWGVVALIGIYYLFIQLKNYYIDAGLEKNI